MNAMAENKTPETGTIKAPFDAIHISKEDGIMIATFAHQNCRILRIECGACDFDAGNVLGLNGLEGKIEITGIQNQLTQKK